MKNTMKLLVVAIALLIGIPAAFAQTPEVSTLPVTEPLDVGGTILQPGTYLIRVLPKFENRDQIQITSMDGQKVFATVLTIPHPLEPGEDVPSTTFVYFPAGEGSPRALRTWFAPHPDASGGGHDIVYEEARAKQLARLANAKVVSYRGQTEVAQLNTTPLEVVTPEANIETYTYTPPAVTTTTTTVTTPTETPSASLNTSTTTTETETGSMASASEKHSMQMPATASDVPLFALLGLLSIGGAVALRTVRPE